ncbi:MAG: tryptophan--tRNA ligase [Candidatus Bathyarchaeia archaeon]
MERKAIMDPWSIEDIEDYSKLFSLFGIEPIEPILKKIPYPNRYFRRKIIFGHRDLDKILKAIQSDQGFAVMSGIKPTGEFHLGTKMTAEEIIHFQKLSKKARAFYCIADIEAYADNGIPLEKSFEIATGNVADLLALGLDPKKAYVYRQSSEIKVLSMAMIFSRGVTYNMMEAIYGEKPFGLYFSALVQVADILLPQLKEFGGPKPVIVPVGADQDPHIRLTRDIADKYKEQFNFILPGATYHKLIRSLTGKSKMSKRDPMSYILLTDDPEYARKKVMNCLTGGRETTELQRSLGGEPEKCVNYEIAMFHFIEDDEKVRKIYEECLGGKRLCGECKCEVSEYVVKFLKEHQRKRNRFLDKALELLRGTKR